MTVVTKRSIDELKALAEAGAAFDLAAIAGADKGGAAGNRFFNHGVLGHRIAGVRNDD